MARGRTARIMVQRFDGDGTRRRPDELIAEEPLEMRLDDTLVNTTMRTPGHDFELAAGFCHTEGLLDGAKIRSLRYCGTRVDTTTPSSSETESVVGGEFNTVSVDTRGIAPTPTPRLGTTTSACGICGSTAIADLRERLAPLTPAAPWDLRVLAAVPDRVRGKQALFERTGGVHAAAVFDRHGDPVVVREDVGRHNAVDKVVGRLLLDDRLPATDMGLYVSGRASFEIVQKAWAAGINAVVAVSAPSSLAAVVADVAGITLCGFVRCGQLNVYAVANSDAPASPHGA